MKMRPSFPLFTIQLLIDEKFFSKAGEDITSVELSELGHSGHSVFPFPIPSSLLESKLIKNFMAHTNSIIHLKAVIEKWWFKKELFTSSVCCLCFQIKQAYRNFANIYNEVF